MEKLILKDGTEITIKAGAGLTEITAVVDDFTALGDLSDALKAPDNLKKVQFTSGDSVSGEYADMKLLSPLFSAVDIEGGKVVATFGLAEKTEIEKEIELIKAGQALQDGAIKDLGDVVSAITEGGAV